MIDTEGHRFCLFRCHCSLLLLALRSRTAAFGEGSQYLLGADATFGCASNALETYIQRAARLLSICPVTFFSQAPSAGVAGVLPTPATPNSRFPIGAVLPGVVEAMRRVGAIDARRRMQLFTTDVTAASGTCACDVLQAKISPEIRGFLFWWCFQYEGKLHDFKGHGQGDLTCGVRCLLRC